MGKSSIKTAVIAIISFSFALTSCNTRLEVTKRKYRTGYHVSISNSKNKQGRILEESIKEKEVQRSIHSKSFDSPSIIKSKDLERFSLSDRHQKISNNSPKINSKSNLKNISSIKKTTLVKNIKTVRGIKKKMKNLKHRNSLQETTFDDDEIDSDLMFVLLLLLAVIIPPACVYMIKGKDSFPFKLNLVLWLIGLLGFGLFSVINFVWLSFAFAIVHAMLVLLGYV